MTQYEIHVAYLTRLGKRRIARAEARVRRHTEACDKERGKDAKRRAAGRLRCAEKRVLKEHRQLTEDIATYTRNFKLAAASQIPPLPY